MIKQGITTAGKTIFAFLPPKMVNDIKMIPGATYSRELMVYTFPATSPTAVRALGDFAKNAGLLKPELPTFAALPFTTPDANYPAWKHQQAAIDFAKGLPGVLLDMDMGTGKTKVAIDLILGRGHGKVLVLCPLNAVSVWERQFSVHTKAQIDVRAFDRNQRSIEKRIKGYGDAQVCIANYDMVPSTRFANWAWRQGFDLVICDESHRIKDPTGTISQWVGRLGWKTDYRLALTGTPAPNGIQDTFAQFRFVDAGIYGTSYTKFCQHYTVGEVRPHVVIKGYKNMDEYRERYKTVSYSITAEEAGLNLPPFVHDWRYCSLEPAAKKVYNDLKTELIAEIKGQTVTVQNALVKLLRLHQITSGQLPDDRGNLVRVSGAKEDLFRDLMLDMPLEPLVVFYQYSQDCDTITRCANRPVYYLNGQAKQLDAWRKDDKGILVVQLQAGNAAEDFTHARLNCYYSISHKNGDYRQSLRRSCRPGQEKSGTYIHTVVKGTIDEYIYKNNDKKQSLVEMILNGGYDEI